MFIKIYYYLCSRYWTNKINKMAIIKCAECEHQISSKAESCPNCGYPINKKKLIVKQRQGCFMTSLNIGCLGFIILVLFFAIAIYNNKYFKSNPNTIHNETKSNINNNTKRGSR